VGIWDVLVRAESLHEGRDREYGSKIAQKLPPLPFQAEQDSPKQRPAQTVSERLFYFRKVCLWAVLDDKQSGSYALPTSQNLEVGEKSASSQVKTYC
jgi:hypothetical protein